MKFWKLCCCCCFTGHKESLDVRSSGYYDSNSNSDAETNEISKIWEMTLENYREILNGHKFVLVQFNDRR
jgi:hypothetical protein